MNLIEIINNRKRILGINERNLKYIRPYNKKKARKIADDKLLTKKILEKAGIPVPKMITSISNFDELEKFNWESLPQTFVLKPVTGLEGGGIEIFYNRDKQGRWIKADGSKMSLDDIKNLSKAILEGKYSLHNLPDKILIEERVKFHKVFKYYAYKGAPDIRIVVFNNIPIMSYVRLPTKESDGKANLAKGAIGAAIDIATGVTTHAVRGKTQPIENMPGTTLRLSGIKIPYWNRILKYAVECQRVTGLGYAAIDFLIDREVGPVIVELNARPGLSIQIANRDGLKWRLEKASGLKVKTIAQGIRLGKDLFGGQIEEEVENITGKQVIGFVEWVTLLGKEGIGKEQVKAKIDSGAFFTSIDTELAKKLGYGDALDYFNSFKVPDELTEKEAKEYSAKIGESIEKHDDIVGRSIVHSSHGTTLRPTLLIKLSISGIEMDVKANIIDRSKLIYPVIVGRRDMGPFIIDPNKSFRG